MTLNLLALCLIVLLIIQLNMMNHISKYAKNWDIERISLMDRTILRMGIGEMVKF